MRTYSAGTGGSMRWRPSMAQPMRTGFSGLQHKTVSTAQSQCRLRIKEGFAYSVMCHLRCLVTSCVQCAYRNTEHQDWNHQCRAEQEG